MTINVYAKHNNSSNYDDGVDKGAYNVATGTIRNQDVDHKPEANGDGSEGTTARAIAQDTPANGQQKHRLNSAM